MQSRINRKLVAIILANGIRNQLHPLTMNFPITNLPIGNKKLIVYQLEQLEQIQEIGTIIITYSQQSIKLKTYIESQFLVLNPAYPHPIEFYRVDNNLSEYSTLQKVLNDSTLYADGWDQSLGLLLVPRDLICSIKYRVFVQEMLASKADLGVFGKIKKQYGKDQKKPEVDYQANFDIGLFGQKGELYTLRSVENYEYCGFSLPASIYQKATHATFQRIIDTRLYTFSPRIIKIIKSLQSAQLCQIKSDLVQTLIRNQNNTNLLTHTNQPFLPLKIFSKLASQNEYIRSITSIPIYEMTNLDSLIRGPKQKQTLMPNKYTQPLDQKYMQEFRGCLIGKDTTIETGNKFTRCIIQNGCKIGKGVDISNSVLMTGTTVEDGCKIANTVVGGYCQLKMHSVLLHCQLAMGCVVEKGASIEKQMIIPLQ